MSSSKVLTTGTFDVFHAGHASFLRRASVFGDVHVGILTDSFVKRYKGRAPLYREYERMTHVNIATGIWPSLVDHQFKWFERNAPAIVVVGSDWADKDYMKQIGCPSKLHFERAGLSLVFVPYTLEQSTTALIDRVVREMHQGPTG
jgi:cytidyltransferase-like protein